MIVFDSKTGNVKRFIQNLGLPAIQIKPGLIVEEPYMLITFTTGFGEVPTSTIDFLTDNHTYLRGVASSGNRNWGHRFGVAADLISQQYHVPVLHKFEISGTKNDISRIKERIETVVSHSTK